MFFRLTEKSSNRKTGPIPVSTTAAATCPSSCPLQKNGCYADGGPLAIVWRKLDSQGDTFAEFLAKVSAIPAGQLWRHNQAGDLPGLGNAIDGPALRKLVKANFGKRGFTYTHKPLTAKNAAAIRHANDNGFVVNVSTNSLSEVDAAVEKNVGPVVTVLDSSEAFNHVITTVAGNRVVVCPATYDRKREVSCATCKLCAISHRKTVVGFPAHGSSVKRANAIAAK